MSVYCDDEFYSCVCEREKHHRPPHRCDCGGSWTWVKGKPVILSLPDLSRADLLAVAMAMPISFARGPIRFVRPPKFEETAHG